MFGKNIEFAVVVANQKGVCTNVWLRVALMFQRGAQKTNAQGKVESGHEPCSMGDWYLDAVFLTNLSTSAGGLWRSGSDKGEVRRLMHGSSYST